MKKLSYVIIILMSVIIILFVLRFFIGGNEDSWIKNEKGIWIKHGNPAQIPGKVLEQQDAVACALALFQEKNQEGMDFSSQCLGTCGDYAVDVVHVPRNSEDNLKENQCSDYPEKAKHFIELDKDGNIFRIV